MASPADRPPPSARSRWHHWWKFPLFFAVLAGAIALVGYRGPEALLLLLFAYLLVRAVVTAVALVLKARKK